jgi:hypothetical protein
MMYPCNIFLHFSLDFLHCSGFFSIDAGFFSIHTRFFSKCNSSALKRSRLFFGQRTHLETTVPKINDHQILAVYILREGLKSAPARHTGFFCILDRIIYRPLRSARGAFASNVNGCQWSVLGRAGQRDSLSHAGNILTCG